MIDKNQNIQALSYALGLAIGALEVVSLQSHDVNKAGVENVLKRLKEIAETPRYVYLPKAREFPNG